MVLQALPAVTLASDFWGVFPWLTTSWCRVGQFLRVLISKHPRSGGLPALGSASSCRVTPGAWLPCRSVCLAEPGLRQDLARMMLKEVVGVSGF